jgi:hypothetical protein
MDRTSVRGKFWFDQDISKIGRGFKLVRTENNRATARGIFANFSYGGVKARHRVGFDRLRWRQDSLDQLAQVPELGRIVSLIP